MNLNQAKILKIAAVAIAAPRYMGAFGAAIGLEVFQMKQLEWLPLLEVYSGGAMAVLEGFALAFVLSKWRLLKPGLHWAILLTFICLLAATLPAVAVPYLLTEQNDLQISKLFADMYWLQVCWSFLVAGVPMLVIMAVGFADVPDELETLKQQAEVQQGKQQLKSTRLPTRATEQPPQPEPAAGEQAEQTLSKVFVCSGCHREFSEQKALNGHKAHCKAQQNGKASFARSAEVTR